jgi:hypothetical protein
MTFGATRFGHIYKKRLARQFKARRRARALQQERQQRVAADTRRTAELLLKIYGREGCEWALR